MKILAVDPGLSGCGWAVFDGDDLLSAGFAKASEPARTPEAWGPLAASIFDAAPAAEKIVVELMRTYVGGKSDPDDLFALQGLSGTLVGLAHGKGLTAKGYLAAQWKGQVPRDVMGARVEREVVQRGWSERVRWPSRKTWRNDVLHAIGLGKYASR